MLKKVIKKLAGSGLEDSMAKSFAKKAQPKVQEVKKGKIVDLHEARKELAYKQAREGISQKERAIQRQAQSKKAKKPIKK